MLVTTPPIHLGGCGGIRQPFILIPLLNKPYSPPNRLYATHATNEAGHHTKPSASPSEACITSVRLMYPIDLLAFWLVYDCIVLYFLFQHDYHIKWSE